ncbi:MAG: hypothetical protein IKW08_01585 [Roseburia sp.]|nr:hypothetical protein [Roseburia sp.]
MRNLLEIRDQVIKIYNKTEFIVVPVLKFMLAFLMLSIVSGKMGYMYQLDNLGLVLILSLMCSFLPNGFIVFFAAVLSMAHIYALSLEVAIVTLAIYMILFLVFFRFCSGHSLVLIFTVILAAMKIPFIVPIVVGLVSTPAAMFAVICGLIGYQMLNTVVTNAMAIHTMGDEAAMAKIRLVVDSLVKNKELLVMIIAFSFTIVVVYLVRRLAIDYAWTIAMAAGAIANLVLLLIGDLMYDTNMSVGGAILGLLLALAVGKVFEFFCFSIDYSRIENVQFEDDEYYYYVKAIPKMTVAAPEKKVKRINMQTQGDAGRPKNLDKNPARERSVVVERVGEQRRKRTTNERIAGGKSVTVGKREISEIEEFFDNLDEE